MQEDFQTEGKDFDLGGAAQHHGSPSIIWSCSVTRARSVCVPSATGDMELLTHRHKVLWELCCWEEFEMYEQSIYMPQATEQSPACSQFLFLKCLLYTAVVLGFISGLRILLGFFFRLDWVILCGKGRGDAGWDKFSVFWKGLRVDWGLLWDTGAVNCCKCRHNAWVSKILVTLAQPIDTFRNLLQSLSSIRKHDGRDPVVPSMSKHLLWAPGGWTAGEPVKEEWWLFWGQPVLPRDRNKPHSRSASPSSPCGTTLREILSIPPSYFVLWVYGLSPLFLTQVNTHRF